MSVSTYCSIGGHQRCPRGACSCACHDVLLDANTKRALIERQREEPAMPEPTSVECPECFRKIGNQAGLASHIRSMHPGVRIPEPAARPSVPPPSGGTGLVWEEPPAPRGRGLDFERDFTPLVVELRRNPDRWARIRTYTGKTTAGTMVKRFRDVFTDIEFRGRRLPAGGSAIWGRFVEPEEG